MYKYTRGLREWTLDPSSFLVEFERKCKIFDIIDPRGDPHGIKFYSQQDEDKYIIQYLLKGKITDGTYLEIGACDGRLYSNTKILEDHFGFKGILIEPQFNYFSKLKENRSLQNNELYNCAVTNTDADEIDFIGNNPEGGVAGNINTDLNRYSEGANAWHKYKVKNRKMKDILQNSKFNYIDFMIIDVEGSEMSLLESIDFNFPIFCIIIEAHSTEQEKNKVFGEYLKSKDFIFKERQRGNEVWINHNYFRKYLFNI